MIRTAWNACRKWPRNRRGRRPGRKLLIIACFGAPLVDFITPVLLP